MAGCRIRVTYARPRTRGSGRRFYNSNMRCYQCGYTGHFYRDCPDISAGGDKRDRYSIFFQHVLIQIFSETNCKVQKTLLWFG